MKPPAKSFLDLQVWQRAHRLVLEVYQFTRLFPEDERYGLVSQIRRAAVSVPANIAEGFPKRGANDKMRYFNIAQGSLEEVHYYLILASDLGYGNSNPLIDLYRKVSRMLGAYIRALRSPATNS